MTMGIVVVACLAAKAAGVAEVTMTSILRRTSSAASPGSRSVSPSAQRVLNDDVPALDVAEIAQPLPEARPIGLASAPPIQVEDTRSGRPSPPAAPRRRAARRGGRQPECR